MPRRWPWPSTSTSFSACSQCASGETEGFFAKVTEVREALRGIQPSDVEPDIEQVAEEP